MEFFRRFLGGLTWIFNPLLKLMMHITELMSVSNIKSSETPANSDRDIRTDLKLTLSWVLCIRTKVRAKQPMIISMKN